MIRNPYRRSFAAYVAGIAVIGGLMAIVALGGNAVAPRHVAAFSTALLQTQGK